MSVNKFYTIRKCVCTSDIDIAEEVFGNFK